MEYRVARIPKGNGKFREIYIPSSRDKIELRALVGKLEEILLRLDSQKRNYAFQRGRNCALNALQHIGYKYTLTMDLEDFFDTISRGHLEGLVPNLILDRCFINGRPRQGLPTSPIISSIAFLRCDKEIMEALEKTGIDCVYTRYADDLTVSFDDAKHEGKIRFILKQVVEKSGFKINAQKSRLQSSSNGRVIITGIGIDRTGLYPTRRT